MILILGEIQRSRLQCCFTQNHVCQLRHKQLIFCFAACIFFPFRIQFSLYRIMCECVWCIKFDKTAIGNSMQQNLPRSWRFHCCSIFYLWIASSPCCHSTFASSIQIECDGWPYSEWRMENKFLLRNNNKSQIAGKDREDKIKMKRIKTKQNICVLFFFGEKMWIFFYSKANLQYWQFLHDKKNVWVRASSLLVVIQTIFYKLYKIDLVKLH